MNTKRQMAKVWEGVTEVTKRFWESWPLMLVALLFVYYVTILAIAQGLPRGQPASSPECPCEKKSPVE
jgi:hypothetical protein